MDRSTQIKLITLALFLLSILSGCTINLPNTQQEPKQSNAVREEITSNSTQTTSQIKQEDIKEISQEIRNKVLNSLTFEEQMTVTIKHLYVYQYVICEELTLGKDSSKKMDSRQAFICAVAGVKNIRSIGLYNDEEIKSALSGIGFIDSVLNAVIKLESESDQPKIENTY